MTNQTPSEGALKVWHIPQVPGKSFDVSVDSIAEARKVLEVLAEYDLFQYRNNIKPDYANAQGIAIVEDGAWTDYEEIEP